MSNAELRDLLFVKQCSESLVDSVFFGNGGTQWLEKTSLYDQYTNIKKIYANDGCEQSSQRLYSRKCLNDSHKGSPTIEITTPKDQADFKENEDCVSEPEKIESTERVNNGDNSSNQSCDNGKTKSRRKRRGTRRKQNRTNSKDSSDNNDYGSNFHASLDKNKVDTKPLRQDVKPMHLNPILDKPVKSSNKDTMQGDTLDENDADDEEDNCEINCIKIANIKSEEKIIKNCVLKVSPMPLIDNTETANINSDKNYVNVGHGALSSTPTSKLSYAAPEFIPTTEHIYSRYIESSRVTSIPITAKTTYPREELLKDFQEIFFPYETSDSALINSETYHYSEESSVMFHSHVIEHQHDVETYLQPFNSSTTSNDSGIVSEGLHSPFSPNRAAPGSPPKFQFKASRGYQEEKVNIMDEMDYDTSFPPLHRYVKNTRISQLVGRTFDSDLSSTVQNSISTQDSKYQRNHETTVNHRINEKYCGLRRNDPTKRACTYCKRIGKDESMFDSHCLRNPITKKLMCPTLVDSICAICGDTNDDKVHTTNECQNRTQKQVGFKTFDPLLE